MIEAVLAMRLWGPVGQQTDGQGIKAQTRLVLISHMFPLAPCAADQAVSVESTDDVVRQSV